MTTATGSRFTVAGLYDFEAGQTRIAAARRVALDRSDDLTKALAVLRTTRLSTDDAVRVLHAVSAGLLIGNLHPSTCQATAAASVDGLADEIQFGETL